MSLCTPWEKSDCMVQYLTELYFLHVHSLCTLPSTAVYTIGFWSTYTVHTLHPLVCFTEYVCTTAYSSTHRHVQSVHTFSTYNVILSVHVHVQYTQVYPLFTKFLPHSEYSHLWSTYFGTTVHEVPCTFQTYLGNHIVHWCTTLHIHHLHTLVHISIQTRGVTVVRMVWYHNSVYECRTGPLGRVHYYIGAIRPSRRPHLTACDWRVLSILQSTLRYGPGRYAL